MGNSLGFIEVVGLTGAIEAGDTALKTSNVELLGYELTKGNGFVVVKIKGNISEVQAGVSAGIMAAEKITKVISHSIISRPSKGVLNIVENREKEKVKIENNKSEEKVTEIIEIPKVEVELINKKIKNKK